MSEGIPRRRKPVPGEDALCFEGPMQYWNRWYEIWKTDWFCHFPLLLTCRLFGWCSALRDPGGFSEWRSMTLSPAVDHQFSPHTLTCKSGIRCIDSEKKIVKLKTHKKKHILCELKLSLSFWDAQPCLWLSSSLVRFFFLIAFRLFRVCGDYAMKWANTKHLLDQLLELPRQADIREGARFLPYSSRPEQGRCEKTPVQ